MNPQQLLNMIEKKRAQGLPDTDVLNMITEVLNDAVANIGILHAVPWLSQWSHSATAYAKDCGPACVAMVLGYFFPNAPTVDAVARYINGNEDRYTTTADFIRVFNRYGINRRNHGEYDRLHGPLKLHVIQGALDNGRIPLALVDYSLIGNGNFPHWIVIVGYNAHGYLIHDPYARRPEQGQAIHIPAATLEKALLNTKIKFGNQAYHGLIAWRP